MGVLSIHNLRSFISKYKVAMMVVVAGFASNMVVKGLMKSVGELWHVYYLLSQNLIIKSACHIYIYGFYHLFSGILFDNFLDKWEGKISEVSASIVPTLMHVLFNTISKLISILQQIEESCLIHINVNEQYNRNIISIYSRLAGTCALQLHWSVLHKYNWHWIDFSIIMCHSSPHRHDAISTVSIGSCESKIVSS